MARDNNEFSQSATPRGVGRLRLAIIGAMLAGKISYYEAQRLQGIKSNIERAMECVRAGVKINEGE